MFMDNIKLFATNEKESETLIHAVRINCHMKNLSVNVSYKGGLKRNLKNYLLTCSAFYV